MDTLAIPVIGGYLGECGGFDVSAKHIITVICVGHDVKRLICRSVVIADILAAGVEEIAL